MLVSLNKGTAAMLVYTTNPPGIQLYYRCKRFLSFRWKNDVTDHVSENTLISTLALFLAQGKCSYLPLLEEQHLGDILWRYSFLYSVMCDVLKLGRRERGHFVTLVQIRVHLI